MLPGPMLFFSLFLAIKSRIKQANSKNIKKNNRAFTLQPNMPPPPAAAVLYLVYYSFFSFSINSSSSFLYYASNFAFSSQMSFLRQRDSVIYFYFSIYSRKCSSFIVFSISLAVLPSLFLSDSSIKPNLLSFSVKVYLSFKAHSCNTVLPMLFCMLSNLVNYAFIIAAFSSLSSSLASSINYEKCLSIVIRELFEPFIAHICKAVSPFESTEFTVIFCDNRKSTVSTLSYGQAMCSALP